MLLEKLCDVLGTDIVGLHSELSRIPNIRVFERKDIIGYDSEFYKSANTYSIRKDDYDYTLIIQLTDEYVTTLIVKKEIPSIRGHPGHLAAPEIIAVSDKEAETLFLELIAKRIVRVKSARN